jgi:hypothetical protein
MDYLILASLGTIYGDIDLDDDVDATDEALFGTTAGWTGGDFDGDGDVDMDDFQLGFE